MPVSLMRLLPAILLWVPFAAAYSGEIPTINGPIPPVPFSSGMKKRTSEFVHPGLWHTHDQLEDIRNGVMSNTEPWASAYVKFAADKWSSANYTLQGPKAVLSRGAISNYSSFANDARAAYQNAIMWYITKDDAHLNLSSNILNTWGSNLTDVIGVDRSLFVGLDGDIFVNAAEIIRWEAPGASRYQPSTYGSGFSAQFYWLFSRQSIDIGQANYGFASIKAMLSFATFLDDIALYNYALHAYQNDYCAGIPVLFDQQTGQSAEAGRDQSHVRDSIGWAFLAARVISNQGKDLYGLEDNLIFRGAEYSAKYNQNQTVPYDPAFYRCEAGLVGGPWPKISDSARGILQKQPMWDIVYYQAKDRGIDLPWVGKAKAAMDLMGGEITPNVSMNDFPSWGDLLWGSNATALLNGTGNAQGDKGHGNGGNGQGNH